MVSQSLLYLHFPDDFLNGARKKKHPDCGNSDPERQTSYVLTHKWILDINQRITRLQSTTPREAR